VARMGRDVARRLRRIEEGRRRAEQRQWQREQDALRREQQELERQQREAELYEADTGLGICFNCGSRNLVMAQRSEGDAGCQSLACCLGCLFWWPILLLIPFLHERHTEMVCQACGHKWKV
jgi:DNA-directed RNA polymerase subunit RPC12/RpoP